MTNTKPNILGATGTREEPSKQQRDWSLDEVLQYGIGGVAQFHHGCCLGSDEWMHRVAKSAEAMSIVLHPPILKTFEMEYTEWDYNNCVWYPRKPYLDRDRDIIKPHAGVKIDRLLAIAKEGTDITTVRSGTWYTVRTAVKNGVPVDVCYPSGKVVKY